MADDDEVGEGSASDPTFATAGPRRSTFTPPTGDVQQPSADETPGTPEALTQHDDDALADALAADLSRLNTGTLRTVPDLPPPFTPPTVEPTEQYPAHPVSAQPASAPPQPESAPPAEPARADPVPPDTAMPPAPSAPPAPWSSFPAPDPSQAVHLPDPPERPVRRSLPDEQLLGLADEPIGGRSATLDMIEKLQAQLELRDREARELSNWESDMRNRGTQDAAVASEHSAPTESDESSPASFAEPEQELPPPVASASFIDAERPVAAWPFPQFSDEDAPAPQAEPDAAEPLAASPGIDAPESPVAAAVPQPAPWEQPMPAWAPPMPDTQVFDSAVGTQPTARPQPEPFGAPDVDVLQAVEPDSAPDDDAETEAAETEADEPEAEAPEPEAAEPEDHEPPAPSPQLPAWEVPAPGPNWAPGPEFGSESEPEAAALTGEDEAPSAVDEPTAVDAVPDAPVDAPETPVPDPVAPSAADRAAAWEPQPWDLPRPHEADVVAEPVEYRQPAAPVQLPAMPDSLVPRFSEPEALEPEAPEPEPESDEAEPAPLVYSPPPLVEPTRHGPPVFPSQASNRQPLISPAFGMPPTEPPVDLPPPTGAQQLSAEPVEAESVEPEPVEPEPAEPQPVEPEPVQPEPVEPEPADAAYVTPPPLVEPTVPEREWAAPTGEPLAPSAGDTLEGPTLDAGAVAPAVAASAASTTAPAREFSFDDLLADDALEDEEPQIYRDPEPSTAADSAPEAIFIEPMPVAAGAAVPTDTGSITVIDQAYEEELPDDVDETDRAVPRLGAVSVDTAGVAVLGSAIHPPSGPISTVRVPEDEVVIANGEPVRMRVFTLEESGLEPTAVDRRVGRAARLFWLWFASNSSIVSLGLGASIFALGMSLRQSVVSVLAGVALSFIPLGLTTLAGKRSGQPTMVVSRATFGLLGNILPAILALVTRVFWGAVLLWLLASSVAVILVGSALDGGLGDRQLLLITLAIGFLVALLVAFAGYPLFARIQLILSVISGILVVGLIAMTWKYVDFAAALTTPDGSWALTIGGAVLVFSFVGLVWANSGADLARYQRPGTSGAASMLWATVGTTLPTFILIAYGALLAASDKGMATGFLGSPLDTLTLMLPSWYPIPLIAATGLSLLSGIILTLYSGGFALQAIGVRVRRQWSIVIVGVLLGALALLLTFGVTGGMNELFRDAATTLAVPTAAWAGIFAAEMMVRNRRFESQSLFTRGGVYADVRWLNLIALVVISVIGYGLTTASITWLSWQGYVFTLLGMPLKSDLAASDVGVLVALVLGLLVPLVAGVPAIRRQEAERVNI